VTQKFAGAVTNDSPEQNANFWEHRTTAKKQKNFVDAIISLYLI